MVDVEKFSDHSRTDSHRVTVHGGLYDLLQSALGKAGIRWDGCHHEDRGDGALILVPPDIYKIRFSDDLPYRLADALHRYNQAHPLAERIRLRMALHAGEVYFDEHGVVSTAVNVAFRLVNAEPLKKALRDSDDALALIASAWFFDEVIRNSPRFSQELYFPALVDTKETRAVGWIATVGHRGRARRQTRPQPWRIRLRDPGGRIHGPGVLVRGRYAITSARAVARALGLPAEDVTPRPSEQVSLDVPALPGTGVRRAEVILWAPALLDGGEPKGLGVAGLSIAGPAISGIDEPALRLDLVPGPRIVRLRACSAAGDGHDEQLAWARLPEHGGNDPERVLLSPLTDYSPDITDECRGSDVIDEQTGEILGIAMLTAGGARDHAWLTPIGKIADEWPLLRRIIVPAGGEFLTGARSRVSGRAVILSLVESCMRVPALAVAQSRHQIVSELPLDVMLAAPRSYVDRADVTALLWSCAQVPGALIELAAKIRESPQGGRIAADLANDLERFQARVLPGSLLYVIMPVAGGVRLDHTGSSGHDPAWVTRQAIVEALRGVDLLRDPEGRRMCVEFSEDEIGETILTAQLSSADAPGDDAVLLELVDQLLSRDVAIWAFVYTIGDVYGPGEITESVRAAVASHIAEPLLSREQRRNLHELCGSLAGLDIPQLFELSADHVGHTLRSDPANLHAVLNELEQLPARARDGLQPITVFVEYLAKEQPPESGDLLRAWVDDYVGTRTPLVAAVRSIRDGQPAPRDPEPRFCVVQLDVEGIDASRFHLSVHYQEGSGPAEPVLPPDDNAYSEAEIRILIGRALNFRQLAEVRPAELRIEFFLPTTLINLPVDQWRVGVAKIALGIQYQVVARSLTRLRDLRSSSTYWRDKWSSVLRTEFHSPDGIEWLAEEAAYRDRDRVFVRLIRDDGPLCLALGRPPTPPDHCEALLLALAAGVPVLMWSRRPETHLGGLLAGPHPLRLTELPQQVLRFRQEATERGEGEDHLSKHLTLLYDDADRVPGAGSLLQTLA